MTIVIKIIRHLKYDWMHVTFRLSVQENFKGINFNLVYDFFNMEWNKIKYILSEKHNPNKAGGNMVTSNGSEIQSQCWWGGVQNSEDNRSRGGDLRLSWIGCSSSEQEDQLTFGGFGSWGKGLWSWNKICKGCWDFWFNCWRGLLGGVQCSLWSFWSSIICGTCNIGYAWEL